MRTARLFLASTLAAVAAAGCSAKVEGPAPAIDGVAPQAVCTEQRVTTVTIAGKGLAPLASKVLTDKPELQLPRITLTRQLDVEGADGAGEPLEIADDPADALSSRVHWNSQTEMTFDVSPDRAFAPGLYSVTVKNANGKSVAYDKSLLMVPPPTASKVDPEVLCNDDDAPTTITGDFFIQTADAKPKVGLRAPGKEPLLLDPKSLDDCRDLPGSAGMRACRSLTFVLPKGALQPGNFAVEVTNPEPVGCDNHGGAPGTTGQLALTVVAEPRLVSVVPDLVCTAEGDNLLEITGEGMLAYAGVNASLVLGTLALPTQAVTCAPVPLEPIFSPRRNTLESCTALTAVLPRDALTPNAYDASIRNPPPVLCASKEQVGFTVVSPPSLTSIVPDLVCTAEGDVPVTLTGQGFITVGSDSPTLLVGTTVVPTTATASTCAPFLKSTSGAKFCTELKANLPQALAAGTFPVKVKNPAPAGCSSVEAVSLANFGKPAITSIQPDAICSDQATTGVTVTGTGFITVGSVSPKVTLTQGATTQTFDGATSNCTTIASITEAASVCTTLKFDVPKSALTASATAYDVTVKNPAPAACSGTATAKLTVVPPPVLTDVQPARICSGGSAVTLTGTGFRAGAKVTVKGVDATSVVVASATSATAELPGGLPVSPVGTKFDVTFTNAEGCSSTLPAAVEVVSGPALFFADPSVVYNGITTQATFYGTGFTGAVSAVSYRKSGTTDVPTAMTFTFDSNNPNRVLATIPSGLAAGSYDVLLGDQTSCRATLQDAFTVVDQTTLTITSVTPGFGTQGEATAVVIKADPTAGGGMKAVPRVYFNPANPGPGTLATPLTSVAFQDAGTLTAIVPANTNLTPGIYDAIVVNPPTATGTPAVGVLRSAFTVVPTSAPPPVITGLLPGSVANSNPTQFTISGTGFRTPAVSLHCLTDATTGATVDVPATAVTTSNVTGTSVTASFNAGIFQYAACVVRVTNPDNKTFYDFSALVVTNPAQKLSQFAVDKNAQGAANKLTTPRRGLGSVAGRVTPVARYLFAIGGDSGTTAGALDSVESAPVDLLGKPGTWTLQRQKLTTKRTLAGVTMFGRFVYAVGGNGGTGPLNTVERAYLLDPNVRPAVDDLRLDLVDTGGLGAGVYNYRVSAVMDPNDPLNPGGETLPSDSFGLQLPSLTGGKKLNVTVKWTAVAGAVKYRVYRTAAAGDPAGSEKLIGEVNAPTLFLLDDGKTAGTGSPLPIGSTSPWKVLTPTLNTARQGAGVTIATDPADATKAYLYVLGGQDGTVALTSYELLPLTLDATTGTQTPAAQAKFTPGVIGLSIPRWQVQAATVNKANAPNVANATDQFVYVASGVAANGTTMVSSIEAAKVTTATGQLVGVANPAQFDPVGNSSPARAGYALQVANNFLYTFGGSGAAPSTSVNQAAVCTSAICSGGAPGNAAPYLANSSNATAMTTNRYLMGSALESAFIYIIGGATVGQNSADDTVEFTIW